MAKLSTIFHREEFVLPEEIDGDLVEQPRQEDGGQGGDYTYGSGTGDTE